MYRIVSSVINSHPALVEAFAERGILDVCNAYEGRARTRMTQVFVLTDGRVVKADSRVIAEVARSTH